MMRHHGTSSVEDATARALDPPAYLSVFTTPKAREKRARAINGASGDREIGTVELSMVREPDDPFAKIELAQVPSQVPYGRVKPAGKLVRKIQDDLPTYTPGVGELFIHSMQLLKPIRGSYRVIIHKGDNLAAGVRDPCVPRVARALLTLEDIADSVERTHHGCRRI